MANQSPGKTSRPAAPLVLALAPLCLGIVADRYLPVDARWWWAVAAAGLLTWCCLARRAACWPASALLAVALTALAGCWHHAWWNIYPADTLAAAATTTSAPCRLRAVALEAPRQLPAAPPDPLSPFPPEDATRLQVRVVAISDGHTWRTTSGRAVLLVGGTLSQVGYGDLLDIDAQFSRPGPARNPGEFDFAQQTRADRQLVRLQCSDVAAVRVVRPGSRWSVMRWSTDARRAAGELLHHYLSTPRARLAAALLLGYREQLDEPSVRAFFETGTIHLLSISGLHVGMLAGFIWLALRWLAVPRNATLAAVALLTSGYALLIDAQPPAMRATLLVVAVCGAGWLGRRGSAFNLLAAAAIVSLAKNPADLFRTGPQLSFLVAAILAWLAQRHAARPTPDPLAVVIHESRPWPWRMTLDVGSHVGRGLAATSLVWLLAAPLVVYRFHLVSPAALVLTPIISLPVAGALLCGFGVLAFGGWAPPLAWLLAHGCEFCLAIVERLVTTAQAWPGSYGWLVGPGLAWTVTWYGLALATAAVGKTARWRRGLAAALAVWLVVGSAAWWWPAPRRFECTTLAVGHGLAVLIELPDGQTILYDAGQLGRPGRGAWVIAGVLWFKGITHIDHLVISHADVDHYNAVPELARRFTIGQVWINRKMAERRDPAPRQVRAALERHGVTVGIGTAGDTIVQAPDYRLKLLAPPAEPLPGNDNANSLVLLVEYAGRRILLTGDLEGAGMDYLLEQPPTACDVVLAPHHGSLRSNAPGLAAWSQPRWVVISGRAITAQVREHLQSAYHRAELLHTHVDGAVALRIAPDGAIDVTTWLDRAEAAAEVRPP